jgi:hypothetical protein
MPTPADKNLTFDEDSLSYIVLAKPYLTSQTKQTRNLLVRIVSLPERGTLHQACFTEGGDQLYTSICSELPSTWARSITSAGTVLENERGIVLSFLPATSLVPSTQALRISL